MIKVTDYCSYLFCRYIIKEHVTTLKFHQCKEKYFRVWTKLIARKHFFVTKSTKVCSNHFEGGQPFSCSPHPSLFMHGYDNHKSTQKRKEPADRQPLEERKKKIATITSSTLDHHDIPSSVPVSVPPPTPDHQYISPSCECHASSSSCVICTSHHISQLDNKLCSSEDHIRTYETKIKVQEVETLLIQTQAQKQTRMSMEKLAHSDKLVKIYTGISSYHLFLWFIDQLRPSATKLQYYKGINSYTDKTYQKYDQEKPGPQRALPIESELLITLMKIRLNLCEDDLAFRFSVCTSTVSMVDTAFLLIISPYFSFYVFFAFQAISNIFRKKTKILGGGGGWVLIYFCGVIF